MLDNMWFYFRFKKYMIHPEPLMRALKEIYYQDCVNAIKY